MKFMKGVMIGSAITASAMMMYSGTYGKKENGKKRKTIDEKNGIIIKSSSKIRGAFIILF